MVEFCMLSMYELVGTTDIKLAYMDEGFLNL
jgi:hypothetical protein